MRPRFRGLRLAGCFIESAIGPPGNAPPFQGIETKALGEAPCNADVASKCALVSKAAQRHAPGTGSLDAEHDQDAGEENDTDWVTTTP